MKYLLFLSLFVITGCAHVNVMSIKSFQPTSKVEYLDSESSLQRPYDVACMIDTRPATNIFADDTLPGAFKQATEAAKQCGGDALVFKNANYVPTTQYHFTVIKYRQKPPFDPSKPFTTVEQ